jgi:hypothetical protein
MQSQLSCNEEAVSAHPDGPVVVLSTHVHTVLHKCITVLYKCITVWHKCITVLHKYIRVQHNLLQHIIVVSSTGHLSCTDAQSRARMQGTSGIVLEDSILYGKLVYKPSVCEVHCKHWGHGVG